MDRKNAFIKGLIDGVPIGLGYLSVSFAFGIYAVASGLWAGEAILVSMSCITSAGQMAAVPIIVGGGSLVELAASQFFINLRYALMSITLSQKLDDGVKLGDRLAIAFVNTDEVFAVAAGQFGRLSKWYMFGLIAMPWLGWAGGTALGALAGNILPQVVTTSLGVAIYGMFIAIVVPPAKREPAVLKCVAAAIVLSCLLSRTAVPGGFAVILCAVAASALLAWLAPIEEVEE